MTVEAITQPVLPRARVDYSKPVLESPAAGSRLVLVDAFRFVCAAWVMWIHIPQSEAMKSTMGIARFRMPFFVLLMAYFLCRKLDRQIAAGTNGFGSYLLVRMRRLYVPFVGWTAFYFVFLGACEVFLHGRAWPMPTWGMPVTGQTAHLWFLPFILTVGILSYPVAWFVLQRKQMRLLFIVGAMVTGLGLSLIADPVADWLINPAMKDNAKMTIYRAAELMPCALLGIAVYLSYVYMARRTQKGKRAIQIGAVAVFAGSLVIDTLIWRSTLMENMMGVSLLVAAFGPATGKIWNRLAVWGRYSFGMYAVHLVMVQLINDVRELVFLQPATWWTDLLTLALCIPLSLVASMGLTHCRWTHWLVPMGDSDATLSRANLAAT